MGKTLFNKSYSKMIDHYLDNSDDFVFPFVINEKNNKTRTIITYKDNELGKQLRVAHSFLNGFLPNLYKTSKRAFAYKKGICCLNALKDHLNSNLFIRMDIRSFFESITEDNFFQECEHIFSNYYKEQELKKNLQSVFYNNHLSLGYVTSPLISDIYLSNFDNEIEQYINERQTLFYSRYCDDILISSSESNWTDLEELFYFIKDKLKSLSLNINDKKTRKYELEVNNGVSVPFLGLNLSKNENGSNRITISKNFILDTLSLLDCFYNEKKIKYLREKILSRISYLQKNSQISYQRFLKKHYSKFGKEYKQI